MNRITLHGFYGYGNLGDEAILAAFKKEFHDTKIIVFTNEGPKVQAEHGVKTCPETGRRNLLKQISALLLSKMFILGGGGLLKDYGENSNNLKRWLRILNLAKTLKRKTALCCIGVENIRFDQSRHFLKQALENVDRITVRDRLSKDILQECEVQGDIQVVSDPVLLLSEKTKPRSIAEGMPCRILICLRHWYDQDFCVSDEQANKNFIQIMKEVCKTLMGEYNAELTFVPLRTVEYDDDREVIQEVIANINNAQQKITVYGEVPSVDAFDQLISQQTLVIGMRLHSLIFASGHGVPMIGLEYMPKISAFMNSINQSRYSLDLKTLKKEELMECIDETLKEYYSRSKMIIERVEYLRIKTRNSMHELMQLANGSQ